MPSTIRKNILASAPISRSQCQRTSTALWWPSYKHDLRQNERTMAGRYALSRNTRSNTLRITINHQAVRSRSCLTYEPQISFLTDGGPQIAHMGSWKNKGDASRPRTSPFSYMLRYALLTMLSRTGYVGASGNGHMLLCGLWLGLRPHRGALASEVAFVLA
jgi:hypothetical protein